MAALLAVLLPAWACAQSSLGVYWTPNSDDVAGYKVYYGTASGSYSGVKDVGDARSSVIDGLAAGTTYYVALQAYNQAGLTSALSEEATVKTASAATPAPEIAVSAADNLTSGSSALGFGSATVGNTGGSQTITITNAGSATLGGLAVTVNGANAADFTVSALAVTSLAPGAGTTLQVVFKPGAVGARAATLRIASNDADENPFVIGLSGTGNATVIPTSPEIGVAKADGTDLQSGGAGVAFGALNLGAAGVSQNFTIKNTGTASLTGLAISLAGSHAADFGTSPLASPTLAAGASTTFSVTFKPGAAGSRSATLRIASNDADENSFDIALSGTGVAVPEIAVTKADGTNLIDGGASISFGALNLGAAGVSQSFVIKNTGTASLTGLAFSFAGSHAADFSVSPLASPTLAAGASTTFSVTFKPGAAGSRSATLRIASNDADENPFDIALSGTGVAIPEIAVTKADGTNLVDGNASIAFGSVLLGNPGVSQNFTIKSTGTASLTGLAISLAGSHAADFSVSSLASSTLAPGASATFTVTFKPGAAGSRNAILRVASNDADENPFDIALSGTGGVVPEIAVETPAGADLPSGAVLSLGAVDLGTTGSTGIRIRSAGLAALSGLSHSLSGAAAADFSVSAMPSSTLAPGAAADLVIRFTPGGIGRREALLHIASNDADENPFVLALRGTGVGHPEIDLTDAGNNPLPEGSAVSFGVVDLGKTGDAVSLTLHNRGSADLTGISMGASGGHARDFVIEAPAAGTLKPGQSLAITLRFKPLAGGNRGTTLIVRSNDADENPYKIPLSGTCFADPEISVRSTGARELSSGGASIDFGSAHTGDKGRAQTLTIRNTGNLTLTGLKVRLLGKNPGDYAIIDAPPVDSLAPGESTRVKLAFQPRGGGLRSGELRILSNDADEGVFKIQLAGRGVAVPDIKVRVVGNSPLDPGEAYVSLGKGSVKTFVVTNRGKAKLENIRFIASGVHLKDFAITPLKPAALAPGKSAVFKVRFLSGSGNRWAAVKILSNDPDTPAYNITLIGRGSSSSKSAKSGKTTAKDNGTPHKPVVSTVTVDGRKYRCITIAKTEGRDVKPSAVRVSGNLVDWFSGPRHTTVLKNNERLLKVRDNTPLEPGVKRHIRLAKNR